MKMKKLIIGIETYTYTYTIGGKNMYEIKNWLCAYTKLGVARMSKLTPRIIKTIEKL